MSADITETIDVAAGQEETFDFVAQWQHLDEWDPTFERAERLTDGPVRQGSMFRTVMSAGPGDDVEIRYRIEEHEPHDRLVLRGEADSFTTVDTITFEPIEGGTRITYDASVETGAPDWVDALGTPLFKLVGKFGAARGLRDRLGEADA